MKSIVVVVVMYAVVGMAKALSPEQQKAMQESLLAECKGKEGATDADVAVLLAQEMPTTKGAKCMIACVVETIGIVKDGKADIEGSISLAKTVHGAEEKEIQILKEIYDECSHITDADRCEMALNLMGCVHNSMVKRGIDPKGMF